MSHQQSRDFVYRLVREVLTQEEPQEIEALDEEFEPCYQLVREELARRSSTAAPSQGLTAAAPTAATKGIAFDSPWSEPAAILATTWVVCRLLDYLLIEQSHRKVREALEELRAVDEAPLVLKRPWRRALELLAGELKELERLRLQSPEPANGAPLPSSAAASASTTCDLVLRVREERRGGELFLGFALEVCNPALGRGERDFGVIRLPEAGSPRKALAAIFEHFEKLPTRSADAKRSAEERLRGIGTRLGRDFFPEALALWLRFLWQQGKELGLPPLSLLLLSNEVWVPWELLRLPYGPGGDDEADAPFLAEAFASGRWLLNAPQELLLPLRHLGVVIPGDSQLRHAQGEGRMLDSLRQPGRDVSRVAARHGELLAAMACGRFDGWHFSGHGQARPEHADFWGLRLEKGEELLSTDLEAGPRPLGGARPFVFLNACHSGRGEFTLNHQSGLVEAFIRAGAGAVVGSYWALPHERAAKLAGKVYELALAGLPLGESVRRARLWLRHKHPGEPTWLAYSLFAHPMVRLGSTESRGGSFEPVPASTHPRLATLPPALSSGLEAILRAEEKRRAWHAKKEFSTISAGLLRASAPEFYQQCVSLLRLAVAADVRGPDEEVFGFPFAQHLSFPAGECPEVVFQIAQLEGQIAPVASGGTARCHRALRAFQESDTTAAAYVVIVNRHFPPCAARAALETTLEELVRHHQVRQVALWSHEDLLRRAFNGMFELLMRGLAKQDLSSLPLLPDGALMASSRVELVPLECGEVEVDQLQLRAERTLAREVRDPTAVLFGPQAARLTLLLGEFGFGKTSTLLCARADNERRALSVASSGLGAADTSSKTFLAGCIDSDTLLEHLPAESWPLYRAVLRPVVERAFKEPETPLFLLFDALDESVTLQRPGGFQNLFNALAEVRVPIVLAMRSELWWRRREELSVALGLVPTHASRQGARRVQRICTVRLCEWGPGQILQFLDLELSACEDEGARARVAALRQLCLDGELPRLYRDIPNRPLLLRFIVDTVMEEGLPSKPVQLAHLLVRWARLKITRDVHAPRQGGGPGRGWLRKPGESAEEVVALVWEAMTNAAALMTSIESGVLLLQPACWYRDLEDAFPRLREIEDPTSLFLHSLLLPDKGRDVAGRLRIRFAHRVYQELFLAWHLLAQREPASQPALPPEVSEWMEGLRAAGLSPELSP